MLKRRVKFGWILELAKVKSTDIASRKLGVESIIKTGLMQKSPKLFSNFILTKD